jgi:predicted metal-dependent hydrolase
MCASPTIIRRSVKHARLRVLQDSSVQLIIPNDWQAEEISSLLSKKEAWIKKKQEYFRMRERRTLTLGGNEVMLFGEPFRIEVDEHIAGGVDVDRVGRRLRITPAIAPENSLRMWLRKFAKSFLSDRLNKLSKEHGLKYGRLFVRSQRTKWGGCSTKQNLSLNWRLISAPEHVIDYVILHELLHTKILNHSQTFWVHLNSICPWVKDAVAWLNGHPPEPELKRKPA